MTSPLARRHRPAVTTTAALLALLTTASAVPVSAAALTITGRHIRDSSITTFDIAPDTLVAADLRTNAVGPFEIAPNAVRSSEIFVGAVGASEIATNAVGGSELATNSVSADEIADNAIGRSELADNAVGAAELADNTVTGSNIVANTIGTSDIAVNGVGASEIATGGVTTAEILDATIGTGDLANGAVTPDKVGAAPAVALAFAGTVSIPDNVPTAVDPAWTEPLDNAGMYDLAGNPAHVVAPRAGWYHVSGRFLWAADAVGPTDAQRRVLSIVTSTSTGSDTRYAARVEDLPASGAELRQSVDGIVLLAAGDRIWIEALQTNATSNNALDLSSETSTDVRSAALRAVWVGA